MSVPDEKIRLIYFLYLWVLFSFSTAPLIFPYGIRTEVLYPCPRKSNFYMN